MDEKCKFRQRTTTSGSKRYFGNKVSGSSAVGSQRKKKLRGSKGTGIRDEMIRSYQTNEENPDSERNVAEEVIQSGKRTGEYMTEFASNAVQKKLLKKKMVRAAEQKRAKEAAKEATHLSGKALDKVDDVLTKIGEDVAKFAADNPVPLLCALFLGVVLMVVPASLTSCSMMIGSFNGATVTTSYTAEDNEILDSDAYYTDLESQLQNRMNQIEADYPGYDEYDYALDGIGHDPYELISLLTVFYEDFTASEVVGTMTGVFDIQYKITLSEAEETRTKTETKTRWEEKTRIEEREGTRLIWDEVQKKFVLEDYIYEVEVKYWEEVEYEEEVEYQHYILHITLENKGISGVVNQLSLTDDQLQRYTILTAVKGNKSYLF